jgi:hypothetical protein
MPVASSMGARHEVLQGYVNDMLAVEQELHQAFRRQKDDAVVKAYPATRALLARIEETIDRHLATLEQSQQRLGGQESSVKQAVGAVLGVLAGLYDKMRTDRVSRMLRDDYAALSFPTICYEMLHTTALALGERDVATAALRHLEDYTPFIVELTEALPEALVKELEAEGKPPGDGAAAAAEAVRNARQAWERAHERTQAHAHA